MGTFSCPLIRAGTDGTSVLHCWLGLPDILKKVCFLLSCTLMVPSSHKPSVARLIPTSPLELSRSFDILCGSFCGVVCLCLEECAYVCWCACGGQKTPLGVCSLCLPVCGLSPGCKACLASTVPGLS